MRDHRFYLEDILDAMNSIERFIESLDRAAFETDDKLQAR